jgi:hypothetical protein
VSEIRPTTCVVAAEDPEIAAKIEQPMMLTWSRRPGSKPAHGARPWKRERDNRVRNSNSPMMMNRGRASSSDVVRMFQVYCGSNRSSGMFLKIARRRTPVAIRVRPTQMPAPSMPKRSENAAATMVPIGLSYSLSAETWSRGSSSATPSSAWRRRAAI